MLDRLVGLFDSTAGVLVRVICLCVFFGITVGTIIYPIRGYAEFPSQRRVEDLERTAAEHRITLLEARIDNVGAQVTEIKQSLKDFQQDTNFKLYLELFGMGGLLTETSVRAFKNRRK